MPRLVVSLAIALGLGVAVLAAACASDKEPEGTAQSADEHAVDPACLAAIGTEFPAQHPTPASPERIFELTRILCSEEAVKAMLAGREVGRDLWVRVSYVYEYMEADNSGEMPIAMVNLYFDPPLSYSGEAPFQTDPCSGHYGDDERLDPDDPCMDAPREYGRRNQEFADEAGIVAEVDFRRGEVVEMFGVPVASEEMTDIRGQFGAEPTEASTSATPAPTPAPTGLQTPKPAVCPEPYRREAKVPDMLGGRIQGGQSYKQGYLTIHLPAGTEFLLSSGANSDGLTLGIYDVSGQSVLYVRGDGCEIGRIGDAASDAVFDKIVATLEVGDSYVCPSTQRSVLSQDDLPPEPIGERVTGGSPEATQLGLDLPAGREFIVWLGVSDPGGGFTGVYDVVTKSWLFLGGDGCETSRRIADPAADAVFDRIVASIPVPVR